MKKNKYFFWDFGVLLIQFISFAFANENLDEFNYDQTVGTSFGPADWIQIRCADPQECRGWPDAWEMAVDWELSENGWCDLNMIRAGDMEMFHSQKLTICRLFVCVRISRWCPADNDSLCGNHHQSPINLQRNRALEDDPMYNECIDIHWMAYHDSTCDFETLRDKKAFTIERHALKIVQPIEPTGNAPNEYQLACQNATTGARTWGKIDFSRGFSQWWHLSHIDFHVPSEHTQEGKQYSGELQMYHWYSVNATVAGIHNEVRV